jgi:hypothetical protein
VGERGGWLLRRRDKLARQSAVSLGEFLVVCLLGWAARVLPDKELRMSTEYTQRELATDERILREQAMVTNGVLRRALAIAARDYVQVNSPDGGLETPDAGVSLMIAWVMRASDETQRPGER